MKKLFIILIAFFSFVSVFATNIDYVYADDSTSQEITATGSSDADVESPTWLKTTVNKVSCGPITTMSASIPRTTSRAVLFLEILAPALLIVFGMLDFYKAVASGVEENIKKNKNAFVNRLVAAIIVFLIIALTKFLVSTISRAQGINGKGITGCINCFINNKCGSPIGNSGSGSGGYSGNSGTTDTTDPSNDKTENADPNENDNDDDNDNNGHVVVIDGGPRL